MMGTERIGRTGTSAAMIIAAESVVERMIRVDWDADGADHTGSRIALMREHMRRMALWNRAIEADPRYLTSDEWIFLDLAYEIAADVRAEQACLDQFASFLAPDPLGAFVRHAFSAVQWRALVASNDSRYVQLLVLDGLESDPFEPLLRFFERGGGFEILGNAQIEIGAMVAFRPDDRDEALARPPMPDLGDGVLDEIDRRSKAYTPQSVEKGDGHVEAD